MFTLNFNTMFNNSANVPAFLIKFTLISFFVLLWFYENLGKHFWKKTYIRAVFLSKDAGLRKKYYYLILKLLQLGIAHAWLQSGGFLLYFWPKWVGVGVKFLYFQTDIMCQWPLIITIIIFFWEDELKIFMEFPGKIKQLSMIEIDLWCSFIEFTWLQGCFPGNIPNIFRIPFQ